MTSLITGFIVAIITFPGVIVRQFFTQLACYYFGIPVFKVIYFQPWPPFGVVVHEPPRSPWTGVSLITGPALVNTLLGLAIGFPAVFSFFTLHEPAVFILLDLFLVWLGISIAVHSFPTWKDAEAIMKSMTAERNPKWVQVVGTPLAYLAFAAALGSIFWLDVIYALAIVVGMPILCLEILRNAF